ncbi:MAG: hypothetical protein K1X47_02890 [Cyclobacteriaceae bacterium]|nr:hypothetical protein [Cyclobacteriaceae bacterium]
MKTAWLWTALAAAGLVVFAIISWDLLFAPSTHSTGTVIEKIYVPAIRAIGETPVGNMRRSKYFVQAERQDQYVAFVVATGNDTLRVHCHPDHFESLRKGDQIKFSRYEGEHIHIRYFAHYEED